MSEYERLEKELADQKDISELKDNVIKELINSLSEESKYPEHVDFLVKVAWEKARLRKGEKISG